MDALRPRARGRAVPAGPSGSVAGWLFVRVVWPVVVAIAVISLIAWPLIVDPISTLAAAVVIAIPCVIVWLRRATY